MEVAMADEPSGNRALIPVFMCSGVGRTRVLVARWLLLSLL